ncbi:MAG TPA: phage holin family protein [Candidatus Dormibacteraeota bacterium]|nr:phage holin family protein [Candidatus Dormibacteraeota bacterium]
MQETAAEARTNGKPDTARGLISSVVVDAQRLVALEVALAKQELKEMATANAIAAGIIGAGALLAMLGLLVALPVLVVWLLPWHWEAAAVWTAAYVVLGLLLVIIGKARLQLRLPPRTLDSLKENKEWALRHVRSNSK